MLKINLQMFAAYAGNLALVKVSSAAIAFVGEAVTAAGNLTYQITDPIKQIVDYATTPKVHKFSATGAAEAGTSTTNIKITAHGLAVGDLIVNVTRSNAARLVTVVVDADNVTVATVTSQASGDTIEIGRAHV